MWAELPSEEGKVEEDETPGASLVVPGTSWEDERKEEEGVAGGSEWSDHMLVESNRQGADLMAFATPRQPW